MYWIQEVREDCTLGKTVGPNRKILVESLGVKVDILHSLPIDRGLCAVPRYAV